MAAEYGLRNPKTGRHIRINNDSMLTEDVNDAIWKVEVADLISTYCEDRDLARGTATTPCWGIVDVRACEAIRHVTDIEYDVAGGDPVSETRRLERFDIGTVYDFRDDENYGGDITKIHYGIMQPIFRAYDMDKIDTMSLGVLYHDGATPSVLGTIAVTRDRGPARIVGIENLPSDWRLVEAQAAHPGVKRWLVLLDAAELESWLDFDNVDADPAIKHDAAN